MGGGVCFAAAWLMVVVGGALLALALGNLGLKEEHWTRSPNTGFHSLAHLWWKQECFLLRDWVSRFVKWAHSFPKGSRETPVRGGAMKCWVNSEEHLESCVKSRGLSPLGLSLPRTRAQEQLHSALSFPSDVMELGLSPPHCSNSPEDLYPAPGTPPGTPPPPDVPLPGEVKRSQPLPIPTSRYNGVTGLRRPGQGAGGGQC